MSDNVLNEVVEKYNILREYSREHDIPVENLKLIKFDLEDAVGYIVVTS